jgi:hypothetical protein
MSVFGYHSFSHTLLPLFAILFEYLQGKETTAKSTFMRSKMSIHNIPNAEKTESASMEVNARKPKSSRLTIPSRWNTTAIALPPLTTSSNTRGKVVSFLPLKFVPTMVIPWRDGSFAPTMDPVKMIQSKVVSALEASKAFLVSLRRLTKIQPTGNPAIMENVETTWSVTMEESVSPLYSTRKMAVNRSSIIVTAALLLRILLRG